MEQKTKFSYQTFFQKENAVKIIVILGLAGILLIFMSTLIDSKSENQVLPDNALSSQEYCERLQNELADIISSIDGVGRVKLLLTIENSGEAVYLEKTEVLTQPWFTELLIRFKAPSIFPLQKSV